MAGGLVALCVAAIAVLLWTGATVFGGTATVVLLTVALVGVVLVAGVVVAAQLVPLVPRPPLHWWLRPEYLLSLWLRLLTGRQRYGKGPLREEIRAAEEECSYAAAGLESELLEAYIKPRLRAMANESQQDMFGNRLTVIKHEGLAELEQPNWAIATEPHRRLEHFLSDMPGGSIGLSGPRGAGKSTLIRSVCPTTATGPVVGVVVAAPVQFEPREFILHLFAELCRTLLGRAAVEQLRNRQRVSYGTRVALLPALSFSSFVVVLAGVALLTLGLDRQKIGVQNLWGGLLVVLGSGGLLASSYWLMLLRRQARYEREAAGDYRYTEFVGLGEETGVRAEASQLATRALQDIWFQQTFTTGWSGALRLPIGFEGGLSGTTELARQQMSMPDIVGELRRLIEVVTKPGRDDDAGQRVSVRIGIDELDKIDSPAGARQFMNEIKVLFGIPGCFFLVSVSEDAMSAFERRGLPFRDVFDSSFDDVVRVGYLDAESAVAVVQRRVIGMPIPFIMLGHCMAGGLARDLIRAVRDMIRLNADMANGGGAGLREMCHALVRSDVAGKAEASVTACRAFGQARYVERLQAWLREIQAVPITAEALISRCAEVSLGLSDIHDGGADAEEPQTPRALAYEFLSFSLFSATLLEVFSDETSQASFEEMATVVDGRAPIDRLAAARQAFAISPRVAWDAVTAFRSERRLSTPDFPNLG
jgi:hypothetical protein